MQLTNASQLPVALHRAQLFYRCNEDGAPLTMATVVLKAGFEVDQGQLRPLEEPPPVFEGDVATPHGVVECETVPIKSGCDLIVLGPALTPSEHQLVSSLDVTVRVGTFARTLRVFGDRTWSATRTGSLTISPPAPFHCMPMNPSRSFGGTAPSRSFPPPAFNDNPDGRGFVTSRADARGVALPNVEDPQALIGSWNDHPRPVGFSPPPRSSGLRSLRGVHVDIGAGLTHLSSEAFLSAHPDLVRPQYPAGDPVRVTGMTRGGPWEFVLPALHNELLVEMDGTRHRLGLIPDTVTLVPSENRVFVIARRSFVYPSIARTSRAMLVRPANAAVVDSATSSICAERKNLHPRVAASGSDDGTVDFEFLVGAYPLTPIIESLPLLLPPRSRQHDNLNPNAITSARHPI